MSLNSKQKYAGEMVTVTQFRVNSMFVTIFSGKWTCRCLVDCIEVGVAQQVMVMIAFSHYAFMTLNLIKIESKGWKRFEQ
jgi:hypothetical protein